jgi:hypothetical protein
MRKNIAILTASFSAFAALAFCTAGSAQTLGSNSIVIDGYRYGGNLPVGADKNLDPLRVLIKATDAMGMLRANRAGNSQWLLLGDTTSGWLIDGDGKWNGVDSHVDIGIDYRVPGVRAENLSADGKSHAITVVAGSLAWDEKTPGVFGGKAATSVNERLILAYLMPPAVAVLGRDAATTIKLSKDDRAHNVLTIPVPKLGAGVNLVATLDADSFPIHTSIAYNGHTYTGDFSEMLSDRMDFMVYFPHHVVLQTDGKEVANVEVNWHQADPYLVFPVPKEVAAN